MRNRKVALLAILFLVFCPLFAWAELSTFAIVSDSHIGAPDSVYPNFIRIIEEKKIGVIFHAGDAIHNPGSLKQWRKFFEITGPDKTLYLAPGNHDIRGKHSLAVFLKLFPKPYYSFSDGDTLFVILNTELPGEEGMITGEQFAWLAAELGKFFKHKFVFLHEPLYPLVSGHGLDRHEAERDRLHKLFVQKRVALVVSGHDHLYLRREKDSIVYIIAASSGGNSRYFPKDSDFFRYITATRKKAGYSFVVRDADGGERDVFSIEK